MREPVAGRCPASFTTHPDWHSILVNPYECMGIVMPYADFEFAEFPAIANQSIFTYGDRIFLGARKLWLLRYLSQATPILTEWSSIMTDQIPTSFRRNP